MSQQPALFYGGLAWVRKADTLPEWDCWQCNDRDGEVAATVCPFRLDGVTPGWEAQWRVKRGIDIFGAAFFLDKSAAMRAAEQAIGEWI